MPSEYKRPARARVLRIRNRLRELYGVPRMAPHGRPLDELILTVLSQSTNDRNRDVAFLRLRARFIESDTLTAPAVPVRAVAPTTGALPTGHVQSIGSAARVSSPRPIDYAAMLAAPVAEIEEAIRPGGISKVKSARIHAILAAIVARPAFGAEPRDDPSDSTRPRDPLSLEWMRDAPVARSRAYLCSLPGVGRKTAACVLLFSYGLRDVPVDTHVSRVGTRLGLLRAGAPFDELHEQMLALTPPGEELELHVNLLRHGRRTCSARVPACDACALARMCPSRGRSTSVAAPAPVRRGAQA